MSLPEHSGISRSCWMQAERESRSSYAPLSQNEQADVAIVGAGIAGLSTAYFLTRAGKSVVVIDDGPVGGGETERTTAHLSNALDDRYANLERLHGERGARLAAESHTAAIDEIERIVGAEQIDCDFLRLDGYLFPATPNDRDTIEQEFDAAHRAGLTQVDVVSRLPLRDFNSGHALRFPQQGQFHPVKYMAGLARAIVRDGGRIYSGTHAIDIQGGAPARVVTTQGATITAQAVVIATNTPVNDRLMIHTKQAPYRTYVIGAAVPRGAVPAALYWDTADPYHYVRLQPGEPHDSHDLLIVGGEDHRTGQADDAGARYLQLEEWARTRFPIAEVRFRWSGQVMEPVDGLAFIGRKPMDEKNVFLATGDSGHGMTHGTIAGRLLTDLILGRENPWAALYDPSRVSARAASEFTRENANIAAQYTDWITPGEVPSEDNVPEDSGAVVRHGFSKTAAYRDRMGKLHLCSAVCPHLRGIVRWNHAEKTWDCPVHGSRFDRFGKVVNGPAISDLQPVQQSAEAKR